MDTYKVIVIIDPKKPRFNKTYTCQGHKSVPDSGHVMLTLADERRVFISNQYNLEFDDGWFRIELKKQKELVGADAPIDHGLNK